MGGSTSILQSSLSASCHYCFTILSRLICPCVKKIKQTYSVTCNINITLYAFAKQIRIRQCDNSGILQHRGSVFSSKRWQGPRGIITENVRFYLKERFLTILMATPVALVFYDVQTCARAQDRFLQWWLKKFTIRRNKLSLDPSTPSQNRFLTGFHSLLRTKRHKRFWKSLVQLVHPLHLGYFAPP